MWLIFLSIRGQVGEFGGRLIYRSGRLDFFLLNGRGILEGWCYVPEYQDAVQL